MWSFAYPFCAVSWEDSHCECSCMYQQLLLYLLYFYGIHEHKLCWLSEVGKMEYLPLGGSLKIWAIYV